MYQTEYACGYLNKDAISKIQKVQLPQEVLTVGATIQGRSADDKIIRTRAN